MEQPKILLADSDETLLMDVTRVLERAGLSVTVSRHNKEVWNLIKTSAFDFIIMAVALPDINGRETVRSLRKAECWTPVILMSTDGGASERALALEEGADDYLIKPVDPIELIARIRAVLRRIQRGCFPQSPVQQLRSDDLLLNRMTKRVYCMGQELTLTPKGVAVLEYLMLHPDELISRDRLLDAVWGWDCAIGTRAVDARVAELRRTLGCNPANPRYIETVLGQGYRFVAHVETVSPTIRTFDSQVLSSITA
jgi:DNA-binding response OmpR family regulator